MLIAPRSPSYARSAIVAATVTPPKGSSSAPISYPALSGGQHLLHSQVTDTKGKQEVAPKLVAAASVFTDEVAQSVTIGEAQHAVGAGMLEASAILPLGDVLIGVHPGRKSGDEITLFDGTGVGLQDLAVAAVAVQRAREQGLGIEVGV